MLLQLHRCCQHFRVGPSRLLVSNTALHTRVASRQLITVARSNRNEVLKISDKIKQSSIITRLCSTSPKPKTPKVVGYWLLGCSGMVFTAVVLGMVSGYLVLLYSIYYIVRLVVGTTHGGVTRLTESGLSMVTWKLLGEKLPTTEEEWKSEFERYQQFPEYKYKNMNMTLSEFKWIWWMEYAHRMWGRAIGAAVFLPAALFWATNKLDKGMKIRVAAYCGLVAAQGLMGWYMVKSGLEDRFEGPNDVPRVSQYRLASHLALAFTLYAGLLGGALRVLRPAAGALQKVQGLKGLTACAHGVKAMVFITAISGAFVAGLDAGLVYSSFPKMGDHWVPPEVLQMTPTPRNFTENPVTVQLDHRILGTSTLALATGVWLLARGKKLPPTARNAAVAVGAMAWLQVTLGISTLLMHVPVSLAALHQAGSLALLTLAVRLTHELKLLRYIPK